MTMVSLWMRPSPTVVQCEWFRGQKSVISGGHVGFDRNKNSGSWAQFREPSAAFFEHSKMVAIYSPSGARDSVVRQAKAIFMEGLLELRWRMTVNYDCQNEDPR